jgi:hypothetical protein
MLFPKLANHLLPFFGREFFGTFSERGGVWAVGRLDWILGRLEGINTRQCEQRNGPQSKASRSHRQKSFQYIIC